MQTVKAFEPDSATFVGQLAINGYKEDGVICLRNVLSQDWLNVIESGIDLYFEEKRSQKDAANVEVKYQGDSGSFHYATLMWNCLLYTSPSPRDS